MQRIGKTAAISGGDRLREGAVVKRVGLERDLKRRYVVGRLVGGLGPHGRRGDRQQRAGTVLYGCPNLPVDGHPVVVAIGRVGRDKSSRQCRGRHAAPVHDDADSGGRSLVQHPERGLRLRRS